MDFYEVFTRVPVNGSARNMVASKIAEEPLSIDDLRAIYRRMSKERAQLDKDAGLLTKAQRSNTCYRINSRRRSYYDGLPDSVKKWHNHGQSIKKIMDQIIALKDS